MYSKNTRVLDCNVVSNFKQSAENFRRFKILGVPKGPMETFCVFFNIIKILLHTNGTFSKNLKAICNELLDF